MQGSAVALLAVLRYGKGRMLSRREAEQSRRTDATAALGERMKQQQQCRQQRPGKDWQAGAPLTLFGLKTEWTQCSISLVSSPCGSPQMTTCPGGGGVAGGKKQSCDCTHAIATLLPPAEDTEPQPIPV